MSQLHMYENDSRTERFVTEKSLYIIIIYVCGNWRGLKYMCYSLQLLFRDIICDVEPWFSFIGPVMLRSRQINW